MVQNILTTRIMSILVHVQSVCIEYYLCHKYLQSILLGKYFLIGIVLL